MSIRIVQLLACILASTSLAAQNKHTAHSEQVWLGYFNQSRFTDKWGMWADFHLRTKDNFFDQLSQGVVRLGLTYYLNDDMRLTAGYAYFNHFPTDNHKEISRTEHRPWQQLQWHTKYKKMSTSQWLRFEQRYRRKIANDSTLAPGYNFNFRIRYSFLLQVPLGKNGSPFSLVTNDEIHINFGKEIVYNYFDQNRFFLGLNYQLLPNSSLRFGYMNLFQQQPAGNQYRMSHVARIYFLQNVDFRKK